MTERTIEVPAAQYAALIECYKQSKQFTMMYFNTNESKFNVRNKVYALSCAVNEVHNTIVTQT